MKSQNKKFKIYPYQKNAESIALTYVSLSFDSNIHFSWPSWSITLHHLKPARILPDKFLTTQKSKTAKIDTNIKIVIELNIKPEKRYTKIAKALKKIWAKQMIGFVEFDTPSLLNIKVFKSSVYSSLELVSLEGSCYN